MQGSEIVPVFLVVHQLCPADNGAHVDGRQVAHFRAPEVKILHAVGQLLRGCEGFAPRGEGAVGFHSSRLVIEYSCRDQDIADVVLLFLHPEGDADSDQHFWFPVLDGFLGADLCPQGALASAVPVYYPETSHLVELVIRHVLFRQFAAGAAKCVPHLVSFMLIEGEQHGNGSCV